MRKGLWAWFVVAVSVCACAWAQDCDGNGVSDVAQLGPFAPDGGHGLVLLGTFGDEVRASAASTDFSLSGQSFTIEFWLYRDITIFEQQYVFFNGNETANQGLTIGFRADQRFTFAFWGNDLDTAATYFPDAQWHHWACVYDADTNTRRILRDGVEVASDIAPSDYLGPSGPILLGGLASTAGFDGVIDELRIWNHARSDALLDQDRFIQYDQAGIPSGLHAYYPFGTSPIADDRVGTNDLTVVAPTAPFILETDCNNNGIPDSCDIDSGFSQDCNTNGIPDECDINSGFSLDCNINGILDQCDITSGFSIDCNANGIPDECDIASGFSMDCNANGIPDECEIDPIFPSSDCNGNGLLDACEIANGTLLDSNTNGIPDVCEGVHLLQPDSYWATLDLALQAHNSTTEAHIVLSPGVYDAPSPRFFSYIVIESTDPTSQSVQETTIINGTINLTRDTQMRLSGLSLDDQIVMDHEQDILLIAKHCVFPNGLTIVSEQNGNNHVAQLANCRFYGPLTRVVIQDFMNILAPQVFFRNCMIASDTLSLFVEDLTTTVCSIWFENTLIASPTTSFEYDTDARLVLTFYNTIARTITSIPEINGSGLLLIESSNISNGYGTIDADPLFVDSDGSDNDPQTLEDNDYRLLPGSPSIDAGNNSLIPLDTADIDNDSNTTETLPIDLYLNQRIVGGIVDMGPYEYQGPPPCPADLDMNGVLDFFDLSQFLSTTPDWDENTVFDFFDLSGFLSDFGAGCP